MLCAVNQAAYLLRRQLERQSRDFVKHGGFTERLYASRVQARAEKEPEAPLCPLCSKDMRRRTAGKGRMPGSPFGGVPAIRSARVSVQWWMSRTSLTNLTRRTGPTKDPTLDQHVATRALGVAWLQVFVGQWFFVPVGQLTVI